MIELAEIDENMIRRNLSPVETALAVTRRAELERSLDAVRRKEREEKEGGSNVPVGTKLPHKKSHHKKDNGVGRGGGGRPKDPAIRLSH